MEKNYIGKCFEKEKEDCKSNNYSENVPFRVNRR